MSDVVHIGFQVETLVCKECLIIWVGICRDAMRSQIYCPQCGGDEVVDVEWFGGVQSLEDDGKWKEVDL